MTLRVRIALLGFVAVAVVIIGWLGLFQSRADETDEVLFPDPASRTEYRMDQLRLVLETFREKQSQYPSSLRDLASDTREYNKENHRFDGWGRPIAYTLTRQGYELRSAGPDGTLHTTDDVVLTLRQSQD